MTTIIKPPYTAWQDAEGTIPADKEGDLVARLDSLDGLLWLMQPAVEHRPSIVDGDVLIDRGEWLESSAPVGLKP